MTNPAGIKDDKRKCFPSENSPTPPCKIIKCESDPLPRFVVIDRNDGCSGWQVDELSCSRLPDERLERCLQNRLIRSLLRQAIGSGGLRHRPFSSICGSPSTACSAAISLRCGARWGQRRAYPGPAGTRPCSSTLCAAGPDAGSPGTVNGGRYKAGQPNAVGPCAASFFTPSGCHARWYDPRSDCGEVLDAGQVQDHGHSHVNPARVMIQPAKAAADPKTFASRGAPGGARALRACCLSRKRHPRAILPGARPWYPLSFTVNGSTHLRAGRGQRSQRLLARISMGKRIGLPIGVDLSAASQALPPLDPGAACH